jgi:Metallo-beta-lactamase superfamily
VKQPGRALPELRPREGEEMADIGHVLPATPQRADQPPGSQLAFRERRRLESNAQSVCGRADRDEAAVETRSARWSCCKLAQIGLDPADVDTIFIIHVHFDHMGNFDDFPNAQVYVQ